MKKSYLKVIAISSLIVPLSLFSVACGKKYKVTFVNDNNSDVVRYVKKGDTLTDIPDVPQVKWKYCLWDDVDLTNINQDITVKANCYSSVTSITTNLEEEINVEVATEEASLDYIFRNAELEANFEDGTRKKIYKDDYTLETNGYDANVSGSYNVNIVYNNAKKLVKINVNKKRNYLSVALSGTTGYYYEGLPALVANTEVEGTISYDAHQTLVIGTKSYAWTFYPLDTNLYENVHGNISVTLVDASEIITNKNNVQFSYGTDDQTIRSVLADGLVVKGKYGDLYRVIDISFYTIEPDGFVKDVSGNFNYIVRYGNGAHTTIVVNIAKCDTYDLEVNDVDKYVLTNSSTLNDLLDVIDYDSGNINGELSFANNQELLVGNYEYDYVFTPNSANYAKKTGKVAIHTYKATNIDVSSTAEVDYNETEENVIASLLANMSGTIYYNDDYSEVIDKDLISDLTIVNYDGTTPGTYTYTGNYNDEIDFEGTFVVKKRVLVYGEDFNVRLNFADPDNYEIMPAGAILEKVHPEDESFDLSNFVLFQCEDGVLDTVRNVYVYRVKLVPNDSIKDTFAETEVFDAIALNPFTPVFPDL